MDCVSPPEAALADGSTLWEYLRLGQALAPADVILVMGGHDPSVGVHAARLFARGLAPVVVVSGGDLHVPPSVTGERSATEADAIASYLFAALVPESAVILERKARNTGENFSFSSELLKYRRIPCRSCIAVTKPYSERRVFATGRAQWPDVALAVSGLDIGFADYLRSGIPAGKVLSMLVGEVQRLERYADRGFLLRQEIPDSVSRAADNLAASGYTERALG